MALMLNLASNFIVIYYLDKALPCHYSYLQYNFGHALRIKPLVDVKEVLQIPLHYDRQNVKFQKRKIRKVILK